MKADSAKPLTDEEKRSLRDAFGMFATGVTVITALQSDGVPRGFTANSFTSVSLDPSMLLVCLNRQALSCDVFANAEHFSVNILNQNQREIAGLFASQQADKFELAKWQPGIAGVPLLDQALGFFVCAREQLVEAGDHLVLIGRVVEYGIHQGNPLGYYRGRYFSIGLEEPLVEAAVEAGNVSVGCVLQKDRALLLCEAGDGAISVPKAPVKDRSQEGLCRVLEQAGLKPDMEFLYAIYRDQTTDMHGIFYHGTVTGPAPAGMRYIEFDDLDYSRVTNQAERSMLQRYVEEFRHGSFGVYQGNELEGTVRRLEVPK